jgi:hypothetical protein
MKLKKKNSQFVKLMQIYFGINVTPEGKGGHVGEEYCRLTLVFSSNRPLGVRRMMLGGRNGYSAGNRIRK